MTFIKRGFLAALAVAALLIVAPVQAQPQPPANNDAALLEQLKSPVQGRVSIPDAKSSTLIQPQGREWREMREGPVKSLGGWLLLAVVVALAAFMAIRGKIKVDHGMSGRTIERFNGVERFAHWLTATSFIVLGLSGLNLAFGLTVLRPVLGPEAFASLSQAGKVAHNYLSFPFCLGVFLMAVMWIKHNIFNAVDAAWFAEGGGILKQGAHPPAGKFNGGQKIIFWLVVLGSVALAVSGYILMFPFAVTDMAGMQISHMVHAIAGILLVAVILAHIYIGSIGMEGAFDAMGSGQVDVNWAKEHHSLWAKEQLGGKTAAGDD